jgi:hypothetical protein
MRGAGVPVGDFVDVQSLEAATAAAEVRSGTRADQGAFPPGALARQRAPLNPVHPLPPPRPAQSYGYPVMLKSRKLAYDGRGNHTVADAAGVSAGWAALSPKGGLYLERWVPFRRELAVVVVRNVAGECVCYDAVETIQRDSICHVVVAPAQIPGDVRERAMAVATQAVARLAGAGVFGVELFELADGE